MLTGEHKYPINFTKLRKRLVLSLHYNGSNSFLFLNALKIHQFRGKYSEIKVYTQCLRNISKDFTINNMKKKQIKWKCKFFFLSILIILILGWIQTVIKC